MKVNSRKCTILSFIVVVLLVVNCLLIIKFKLYALNFQNIESYSKYPLSILTFNVNSNDSISFTQDVQRKLIDLIIEEKPDIVCFQELSFENLKKIKPQLDSIYGPCEILSGDDQYWRLRFYSHYPLRNFRRHHCTGDVVTDDMSAEEKSEIDLFKQQMNVMSAEFEVAPGRWVTVFSGHLRSSAYSTARRSMDKGTSWLGGIPLYWRNYKIGKRIRDFEAQNVRRFVDEARANGNTVIVVGDLNDWCGSDCLETLMGNDLKDAWWEGGRGFGWTYFGWHLRLRIDHILYSDELQLTDVKVVDSDLSDHKPLKAQFVIN